MLSRPYSALALFAASLFVTVAANADPPTPSGPHPRLFMSAANLAAYKANAVKKGTAAAGLVYQCEDSIKNPSTYTTRGGSDGDTWPAEAIACAFSYLATGTSQYLTQALTYWQAALSDDQTIGDGLGCVAGVSTDWQSWAAGTSSGPTPPILLTITHDTGYPMRWYGPFIALTYDWLYNAPGVTAALQSQTQTCLTAWSDYYTQYGYHATEAGANYNSGYVVAKAWSAVAIGTDGNADGHLWTQVIDNDITSLLIGTGLAGTDGGVGTPAGVMVGGDWGEGWEYGPLGVMTYSMAVAAVESNGASLPAMDDWVNSLFLRHVYAQLPSGKFEFSGDGDVDITTANKQPDPSELDAVLGGGSSDQVAGWALSLKQSSGFSATGASAFIYNAIAEARAVTASDFTKQATPPPLWYLAHGTREVFARTAWNDPNAYWGVFTSSPTLNSDHQHFAASSFVFTRGPDDLIIDPTPYSGINSFDCNAVTADSANLTGDYAPSQGPWSTADLPWARGTSDAVYAARSDFAGAFAYKQTPSDVKYAHREWAMLPEGEVVTIDRVLTSSASRNMYVSFHANTGGGKLALANGVYSAPIGSSQVVIHPVFLSPNTPAAVISQPELQNCTQSCSYPCGACDVSRMPVDLYRVTVPGTWAVAIHVIDGIASTDQPATVDSINDAVIDPGGQNTGVIGASVFRSPTQSYVVASSAQSGVSPTTMTYGVPGNSAARHIVYDAPEASDGTSSVTASAQAGRCVVSITAGSGGGFTGHPLMFQVGDASGGCTASDSTSVTPGSPPPGSGVPGSSSGGGSAAAKVSAHGGCGCAVVGADRSPRPFALIALALVPLAARRRRHH